MDSFDFHVTLQSGGDTAYQKKKCLSNISKEELRDAVMRKFNIDQSKRVQLQRYVPTVDDWEDIDDDSEIPDGGKIKVVIYDTEDTSNGGTPSISNLLTEAQRKTVQRPMSPSAEMSPVSEGHRQLLTHNRWELSKFLDPDSGLLDQLLSDGAIDDSEFEDISGCDSKASRARRVVSVIAHKRDDCFGKFVNALNKTEQPHVAYMLTGVGIPPMSTEHRQLLDRKRGNLRKFLDPMNGLLDHLTDVFTANDRSLIEARLTKDEQSTETISILMRKQDSAFDRFLDELRATGQSHVVHILTGEGDPPLSDETVALIGGKRDELVEQIDSMHTSLIDKLVRRQVLTDFDRQCVMAQTISYRRNDVLLSLIVRKSQKAYDNFLLSLCESAQEHVATILDGHRVNGRVKTDVDKSKERTVQNGLRKDITNRKTELNENGMLKCNGISVICVDEGSILISFKCRDIKSADKLHELLNSGELDALFTEMFCPSYAAEGLKSLRIVVPDGEFEACHRRRVMTAEHRRLLDDASESIVGNIAITAELLDKLSLCKRRRQSIESAGSEQEQVRTLLAIVSYQPDSAFARLVDALRETGQNDAATFLGLRCESNPKTVDLKDRCIEMSKQAESSHQPLSSGPRHVFKKNELHAALECGSFKRAAELINIDNIDCLVECYFVGDCETLIPRDSRSVAACFKSCLHIIASMDDQSRATELCTLLLNNLGTHIDDYLNSMCICSFERLHYYTGPDLTSVESLSLIVSSIHLAAYRGNVGVIELLLGAGADAELDATCSDTVIFSSTKLPVNSCPLRLSALHLAALGGQVDAMQTLLRHGANVNKTSVNGSSEGHTALFISVMECNSNAVTILLGNGADANVTGEDGLTPLHVAAMNGNVALINLLLGGKVNAIDRNGMTPLCRSVECGQMHAAKLLLEHNADVNLSGRYAGKSFHGIFTKRRPLALTSLLCGSDKNCVTPLCAACKSGSIPIVNLLLDYKADVNLNTPLYNAIQSGRGDIVELLLEKGANANVGLRFPFSKNPLLEAVKCGHEQIVEMLLKHGAAPNCIDMSTHVQFLSRHTESFEGMSIETPLHVAAENNHFAIVQGLLHYGADVNAKDSHGETPLHKAATFKGDDSSHVATLLIDGGANVNAFAHEQKTVLHKAIDSGNYEVAKLLLAHNADVNLADVWGNTPLHAASQTGNEELVRLLLDKEPHVNAANANGDTALDIAMGRGHNNTVRMLRRKGSKYRFDSGPMPVGYMSAGIRPRQLFSFGQSIRIRSHVPRSSVEQTQTLGLDADGNTMRHIQSPQYIGTIPFSVTSRHAPTWTSSVRPAQVSKLSFSGLSPSIEPSTSRSPLTMQREASHKRSTRCIDVSDDLSAGEHPSAKRDNRNLEPEHQFPAN